MKIKTGDHVQVIAGKNKGESGEVIQVFPGKGRVVVDGVNVMVKHLKTRQAGQKGQRVEFYGPIDASNVKLICPKTKKVGRVGYTILEDGTKKRVHKVSKEVID